MKIAVMGAMPEEVTPLLEVMGSYETVEYANNKYYIGSYAGRELVIAYSKIGKVHASLTAASMLQHFGCQKLLFSGVAGAICDSLKIGDLIYASRLCQHDLDITAFGHPYGFVPEGKVFIDSDVSLNGLAKSVAESKGINLKEGAIATGDQFVADADRKNWIKETFKADALEMEGAAVALVCDAMNVPFFILRAISDAADADAGFDFDAFLEKSSKVSADFILAMLEKMEA